MTKTVSITEKLNQLTDEQLMQLAFLPWQYNGSYAGAQAFDEDGFPLVSADKEPADRETLQALCWEKFKDSPQINTNVRSLMGRLTGLGFDVSSDVVEIQDAIEEIELDWRNRLYNFWPKYVGQSYIPLSSKK